MTNDLLIVISHYAARETAHLDSLLSNISKLHKNILISVNDDQVESEFISSFRGFQAIFRPNIGMNIGGWNSAYQKYPDCKYYIFLQDECILLRGDFINAYKKELDRIEVGMTGESINYKWDKAWPQIMNTPLNYTTDIISNGRRISRVENYLNIMEGWGVNPGASGRHLRSLVWGFSNRTLRAIAGFPIGNNKEQCIASEIAVSKKVEQLGLSVTQVSETPFYFFKHDEWLANGVSKKYQ